MNIFYMENCRINLSKMLNKSIESVNMDFVDFNYCEQVILEFQLAEELVDRA